MVLPDNRKVDQVLTDSQEDSLLGCQKIKTAKSFAFCTAYDKDITIIDIESQKEQNTFKGSILSTIGTNSSHQFIIFCNL